MSILEPKKTCLAKRIIKIMIRGGGHIYEDIIIPVGSLMLMQKTQSV